MDFNRHHYLIAGTLLLLLGIQLRMVDSFVLNEPSTRFLAAKFGSDAPGANAVALLPADGPLPRKEVKPPQWLGWALMSIGAVLTFQSLAMRKPAA